MKSLYQNNQNKTRKNIFISMISISLTFLSVVTLSPTKSINILFFLIFLSISLCYFLPLFIPNKKITYLLTFIIISILILRALKIASLFNILLILILALVIFLYNKK